MGHAVQESAVANPWVAALFAGLAALAVLTSINAPQAPESVSTPVERQQRQARQLKDSSAQSVGRFNVQAPIPSTVDVDGVPEGARCTPSSCHTVESGQRMLAYLPATRHMLVVFQLERSFVLLYTLQSQTLV